MLERKYGGSLRSRRAAKIIQRAFRQYSMNKNFEKLRIAVGERRLSKRLSDIGRSSTVYTDRISLDGHYVMGMPHAQSNGDVKRHSDIVGKRSTDVDGLRYTDNRLQQQISLDSCMRREQSNLQARLSNHDRKKLMRYKEVVDESDVPSGQKNGKTDETNNNRNSCPEMNDSSASDSPQPTPLESVVDLHSLDFETLLESKETDILTDSFQSDGLLGDHSQLYSGYGHKKASASSLYSNTSTDTLESNKSQNLTYEPFNQTNYSDSGSFGSQGDIKVKVEGMLQDNIRTPEQKQMADQTLKYYMNQEVKLRGRNDSQNNSNKKPPVPNRGPEASPIWKRKNLSVNDAQWAKQDQKRMSNISETSEADSQDGQCSSSPSSDNINASAENVSLYSDQGIGHQRRLRLSVTPEHGHTLPKTADKHRKRTYRIGLNLFNKKPERGIQFLCESGFLDESPPVVARFLITRKGLSKHMIGEYLGNLQNEFNMEVLHFFAQEVDLSGLQVDMALRKFQSYFRMPGEAQKIERLMEAFASRYCTCNPDQIKNFRNIDTVFLLAFAIIMLNTDLHNSSIKQERKMKLEDFVKNLRDIDDGHDVDHDMLVGIYERIRNQEFRAGVDHVTQVMKVEQTVVGKRPILALPHRRLVCYCRLYEVHDPNKKEKIGLHQREVFLFNDLLLVSKIFSKKKSGITYSYKQSFSLCGMQVFLFETSHYQYGVRLTQGMDNKVLITFNARNEHDRQKFVDDLKEAILESNGMEQIRIEEEMQKHSANHNTIDRHYANDDSRVLMYELMKPSDPATNRLSAPECGGLKKLNLSNSLTDLCQGPGMRRGSSGGSLDSGVASGGSGGVNGEVITPQTSQSSLHSRGSPASGNINTYTGNKGQGKLSAVSLKKGLPAGTEV
ncbi:hypothetical protein FSP39_015703 [Pinctada imbricata]|uniref:SEC7 domain-containing protein n=1 Tax=Pinctada imbricata TaxID=66713 RepID=A0AA89C1X9_PINIB|nr:hypothetical protein FSP39_015703 [Pinctada imbricata]